MNSATDAADRAREAFGRHLGGAPEGCWAAPGRTVLIGDHVDYDGGLSLPCAIGYYTVAAAARSESPNWTVWSANLPGTPTVFGPRRVDADAADADRVRGWAAYPAGVTAALRRRFGDKLGGARIAFASDVPTGAGLSSSAALELATVIALRDLYDLPLSDAEAVATAREAENRYVGAPTGGLDQTASLLGRAGRLLAFDGAGSGPPAEIALPLEEADAVLLAAEAAPPHRLADSGYADRREDRDRVARALDVEYVNAAPLHSALRLPDQVLRRRARHLITEHERSRRTAALLRRESVNPVARLRRVGALMLQSHWSLSADYEVSLPALDLAVDAAMGAGAYGARLTGGGFGGCVAILAPREQEAAIRAAIAESTPADKPIRFFDCRPASGAFRLRG